MAVKMRKYPTLGEILLSNKSQQYDTKDTNVVVPYLEVEEVPDINRSKNTFTHAVLKLHNLDLYAQCSSYIIFYDDVLIENTSIVFDELISKQQLHYSVILRTSNEYVNHFSLVLSNDLITYYSFYVLLLDSNNKPIVHNGSPLILSSFNNPFTGLSVNQTVFGVKDLLSPDITDNLDNDITGYVSTENYNNSTLTLSWFDQSSLKSESEFSKYANGKDYKDTFGQSYELSSKEFGLDITYLIYMFVSNGYDGPKTNHPLYVLPNSSFAPTIEDGNGVWNFVGSTKENNYTVALPANSTVSFWVGFILK